jgi:hypothetical protein
MKTGKPNAEGAPSLRFLQGRVAMLRTQLCPFQVEARCAHVRGSRPSQNARRTGHPGYS